MNLEKPDSKRDSKERERIARNSLRLFRRDVVSLSDFGQCDNPNCNRPGVHSHHIIFKSHGIDNHVNNGMRLCAICHHFAHNGVVASAAERHQIDVVTARKFVIDILTIRTTRSMIDRARWSDVLNVLILKEDV